jgi:hypothetical protein
LRRLLIFLVAFLIMYHLIVVIPTVLADCTPNPGTGTTDDNQVICNGIDANGANVGSGSDQVEIVSGTVLDTMISEGGTLLVIIQPSASLDTSVAGTDAIFVTTAGKVITRGNLVGGDSGIEIYGDGQTDSMGNIYGSTWAIWIVGAGQVQSVGNLSSGVFGIGILGSGNVMSTGDISALVGIDIGGEGNILSTGNISGSQEGIEVWRDGTVASLGNISGDVGIKMFGNGTITSTGNIESGFSGILIFGNGTVTSRGNIQGGNYGIEIFGDGTITSHGAITSDHTGITVGGSGEITVQGSVSAGEVGIDGGSGNQHLDVNGTVNAPIAVRLGDGNDSLYVHGGSTVSGTVDMGAGDDMVRVGDGAVIKNTMDGGEGGEVNGDTILIGDTKVCSEDAVAVALAKTTGAQIAALNPDSDSVTYRRQTYTWTQFEHIASGATIHSCAPGKIADGRMNAYDEGAPDALYCTVGGGISDWRIDRSGQGAFTFDVTAAAIQAAFDKAASTGVNQLIGSGGAGETIYALSEGHTMAFFAPDLREPDKTYQYSFARDLCA